MTDTGEVLGTVRILNDVDRLTSVIDRAGADPEVVLERPTARTGPPMLSRPSAHEVDMAVAERLADLIADAPELELWDRPVTGW